jgi:hypothetical protein
VFESVKIFQKARNKLAAMASIGVSEISAKVLSFHPSELSSRTEKRHGDNQT